MIQTIAPHELKRLLRNGNNVHLIDVRTPAEFQEMHVESARNVPLHQLDPNAFQESHSNNPLYVICQKGGRGKQACEKLASAGVANVFNVEGGTDACVAEGLPVVRGHKTISLERQVRITAGSLVVVGALLAWLVHPAFIALSAFIGAGLVFAGITDTCGMGMLLARMPWNQSTQLPSCETTATGQAKENLP
jgi:rhodanese-related sulfurtransferase